MKTLKKFTLIIFVAFCVQSASAQNYTWADDVACIFYANCTSCHWEDGHSPFPLISYTSAFNNKYSILNKVMTGYMPPWLPVAEYQTYAHERVLTQTEKDIIIAWVNQGAVPGDTTNAPVAPTYTYGVSKLSQIDFTGGAGNYTNNAAGDDYRCFLIPTNFSVDKFVEAIEMIPGNSSMLHHGFIYYETDTNALLSLDAADPGLGYSSFDGTGVNGSPLICAWSTSIDHLTFPSGMGLKIPANAYLVLQLYYPVSTIGDIDDNTVVNFKFAGTPVREVSHKALLNDTAGNISPALFIPAMSTASFVEQYTLPSISPGLDNYTFLSVVPLMRKVGRLMTVYAIKPSNDTVPLIDVDDWDTHWLGQYTYRQPIVLPEGTVLRAKATYFNIPSNPEAPDPSSPVTAGSANNQERMMVYFNYLSSLPGDQNIIVDTVTVTPTYIGCEISVGIEDVANTDANFTIYPNPFTSSATIKINAEMQNVELRIFNVPGQEVFRSAIKNKQYEIQRGNLPAGIYIYKVFAGEKMIGTGKLVAE